MAAERVTIDVKYDRGDEVNWMGCNGHVVALVVTEGAVLYEVQFLDHQGAPCVGRFQYFELAKGHEI
jgi:hypothetical protein